MSQKHDYHYIIERDSEGYYIGSVPELRGCHSQARSLDELAVRMKEVISLCLEDEDDSRQLEFVGVQTIAV